MTADRTVRHDELSEGLRRRSAFHPRYEVLPSEALRIAPPIFVASGMATLSVVLLSIASPSLHCSERAAHRAEGNDKPSLLNKELDNVERPFVQLETPFVDSGTGKTPVRAYSKRWNAVPFK